MASEKRLIDANELMERIKSYTGMFTDELGFVVSLEAVLGGIEFSPTVDAVEVVHGYNIDHDTPSLFECSICHWSCWDTYCGDTDEYNYCPNCGAKMDGDGNG